MIQPKSKKARKIFLYAPSDNEQFFKIGSQYYAAARYGVFAGLMPVAGNLHHHAIEMLLKGVLSTWMSKSEIRYTLSHNLAKAWIEFKKRTRASDLDRFDTVIGELHKFEVIRYPETFARRRAIPVFAISKASGTPGTNSDTIKEPHSRLCLQDIDELVVAIFGKANRDVKKYCRFTKPEARKFIELKNHYLAP